MPLLSDLVHAAGISQVLLAFPVTCLGRQNREEIRGRLKRYTLQRFQVLFLGLLVLQGFRFLLPFQRVERT